IVIERNIDSLITRKDNRVVELITKYFQLFNDSITYFNYLAKNDLYLGNDSAALTNICTCYRIALAKDEARCERYILIAAMGDKSCEEISMLSESLMLPPLDKKNVDSVATDWPNSDEYYYDHVLLIKNIDSVAIPRMHKFMDDKGCDGAQEMARLYFRHQLNDVPLKDSINTVAKRFNCKDCDNIMKEGYFQDRDYHHYGYLDLKTINSLSLGAGYARQYSKAYSTPLYGYNVGVEYDFFHSLNTIKAGVNFNIILNLAYEVALVNDFKTRYLYTPFSVGLGGFSTNISYTRNFFLPKDNVFAYPLNQITLRMFFSRNSFGWWQFDDQRKY
ncbi:MAG: hypothetical protein NT150_05970, partial [Bacteroidetes bacterium]|nr:hypothetical protein [Bacteroidota bacterium]